MERAWEVDRHPPWRRRGETSSCGVPCVLSHLFFFSHRCFTPPAGPTCNISLPGPPYPQCFTLLGSFRPIFHSLGPRTPNVSLSRRAQTVMFHSPGPPNPHRSTPPLPKHQYFTLRATPPPNISLSRCSNPNVSLSSGAVAGKGMPG